MMLKRYSNHDYQEINIVLDRTGLFLTVR